MGPDAYTTWRWVSLSPLPAWVLAALCVAVVAAAVLASWGVRREPHRRRRAILWTLRGLAALAALFFLLEPGVRELQVARMKSRVAVLVDRSASMAFPASPGGASRAEEVRGLLQRSEAALARLRERFQVEIYG